LEREVLSLFYTSTNGDNWKKNDNWNTSEPVSTWYGITTDEVTGRVVVIKLGYNSIQGNDNIYDIH